MEDGRDFQNEIVSEVQLTAKDVKYIQQSWEILAEDKKTNSVKLFMKLFTKYPEAKDMFRQFRGVPLEDLDYHGETTKSNRRMVAHGMSVMYALESYVDSLDDSECLIELVRKTASTHLKRNIGPAEFMWIVPVIQELLDDVVEDKNFDIAAAKEAWKNLMTYVTDIVKTEQNQWCDTKFSSK